MCLIRQDYYLLNWSQKLMDNQMLSAYRTEGVLLNCGKLCILYIKFTLLTIIKCVICGVKYVQNVVGPSPLFPKILNHLKQKLGTH